MSYHLWCKQVILTRYSVVVRPPLGCCWPLSGQSPLPLGRDLATVRWRNHSATVQPITAPSRPLAVFWSLFGHHSAIVRTPISRCRPPLGRYRPLSDRYLAVTRPFSGCCWPLDRCSVNRCCRPLFGCFPAAVRLPLNRYLFIVLAVSYEIHVVLCQVSHSSHGSSV